MGSKNSEWRAAADDLGKMGRQNAGDTQTRPETAGLADPAAANRRKPRRRGVKITLMVLASTLAIFCLAGISAMSELTFMPAWIPWTIAIATALGTSMWGHLVWRWITGCGRMWLNYILHTAMASLMICCAIYLGNQLGASDRGDTAVATVTKVYSETRYHSKRIARNRYVRGEPYKVYFASLRFENGLERDIPISDSRYRRLRPDMILGVGVSRGGLGYDVIRPYDIKAY